MTGTNDEPPEWAKRRARELADGMTAGGDTAGDDGSDEESAGAGGAPTDTDAQPEGGSSDDRVPDVPVGVVDEAERLTRLAREATDSDAATSYRDRRDGLVADHAYTTRVREADDTLVLYPDEWVADGTVRFDRIEDTDRAVEVSLSGPGESDRYRAVAAYNDTVADAVADAVADEAHVANARAFATFMSNHYVRPVDDALPEVRAEFREEYFPRNAWPSDDQRAVLADSLALVAEVAADVPDPEP